MSLDPIASLGIARGARCYSRCWRSLIPKGLARLRVCRWAIVCSRLMGSLWDWQQLVDQVRGLPGKTITLRVERQGQQLMCCDPGCAR